ncbi:MAG: anthranilate phosphoribosyltransferase [Truepera sp.]|nr:anthranilate phosphoribosyltransferase [Truepera sp.]
MAEKQTGLDVKRLLDEVFDGSTLPRERARAVMGSVMDGQLSQVQAAALLAALRTRGETVEEIIGFAEAMRQRAIRVPVEHDGPLLDTCGTGGTGVNTFNISTASMFVAAAGGARVAKHGNRGVTRKSGAADVLEALGAQLSQSPERLAASIREVGLAFIFARDYHPAMKFVAPIRADLKARTIFNSLGPLTNPAGANRQLLGVYSPALVEPLARVLFGLGVKRALVVYGDGIDELTVAGVNTVCELREDQVTRYTLTPEEVGLPRYALEDLLGGEPSENAATIRAVLSGQERGAKRDVVCLNAGAALYLMDRAASIGAGVALAAQLIDLGQALSKLKQYLNFTAAG